MKHLRFARLFNELRLKAGFESLADFGKALAQEGYIYEDSTFSRWKTGTRIPRQPRLVAAIIKIFCDHNAFDRKEEIAEFYESVGLTVPAYINSTDAENHLQVEELAQYLMEEILGKAFISLHQAYLKQYYALAHRDMRKFVLLLKAIQQNPQHYVQTSKYPYVTREKQAYQNIYIKNHALVSKSDDTVMVMSTVPSLSYTHVNAFATYRDLYRRSLRQSGHRFNAH